MATQTVQKMRFLSRPYHGSFAGVPMQTAIAMVWGLVIVGLAVAGFTMYHNMIAGAMIMLVAVAFGAYIFAMTQLRARENRQKVELKIDNNTLSLSIFDPAEEFSTNQTIDLKDVTIAEYYPGKDAGSLTLRGHQHNLDIPLWTFGPQVEKKIIAYMRAHNVRLITIPDNILI